MDFNVSNDENKKKKIKTIWDNTVYIKKLVGHLLKFYYLVYRKIIRKKKIFSSQLQTSYY